MEQKRIRREITAGFIVFRRTQEGVKFLILYHRGTYWNFPKGHIESEENSLNAAIRETKEETGLGAQDLRIMPGFKAYERFYFRKQNQPVFKIVIFYLAETKNRNVKISEEHHGYAWFLYNDAKKILGKYQDSQRVLKQANDFIHPHTKRVSYKSPHLHRRILGPAPNLKTASHPNA